MSVTVSVFMFECVHVAAYASEHAFSCMCVRASCVRRAQLRAKCVSGMLPGLVCPCACARARTSTVADIVAALPSAPGTEDPSLDPTSDVIGVVGAPRVQEAALRSELRAKMASLSVGVFTAQRRGGNTRGA